MSLLYSQSESDRYKDSLEKYLYNDSYKAEKYTFKLLELSQKTNNVEDIKLSYALAAVVHELRNNIDSTLYYYNKGLDLATDPYSVYNFKLSIGVIYENENNYDKALQYYTQCLELTRKHKMTKNQSSIEVSIETIKSKINKSIKSITILQENYKKEKINDPLLKLRFTRKNLAEAYLENNMSKLALEIIDEGLESATSDNNIEFLYYYKKLQAESYLQTDKFILAKSSIESALIKAKKLKNKAFIDEAHFILAKVHLHTNEERLSIHLLKEILRDSINKSPEQLSKYYKLAAEIYKTVDSISLSNNYYQKFILEKEKSSQKNISVLENIYEIDLNQEIIEKEKQKHNKRLWTYAFLLLLISALILFFWYRRKQFQIQKRFDALLVKVKDYESKNHQLNIDNILSDLSKDEPLKHLDEKQDKLAKNDSTFIIDKSKVVSILKSIKALEKEKYYLKQECNLHHMAKTLGTNTSYLSKIINSHLNKTFSAYINELRVNYAIVELKNNKKLRAYSVLAIAKELGYKNSDAFSSYFKTATGITPSVYIKKIKSLTKE